MRWLIPEVLQEAKEQDRLDLACAWLLRCWRPQGEGLPLGQRVDGEVQAPSLLPPPVSSPHAPHRQGLRGGCRRAAAQAAWFWAAQHRAGCVWSLENVAK